jgi:hypothetical protein
MIGSTDDELLVKIVSGSTNCGSGFSASSALRVRRERVPISVSPCCRALVRGGVGGQAEAIHNYTIHHVSSIIALPILIL